jgi:pyruvate/2-oxoglutarate/acetoin dehydrogenase E1 component
LVLVEEGPRFAALGSEIVAQVAERGVRLNSVKRIGHDGVIPSSLVRELDLLPSPTTIAAAIVEMTT